MAADTSAMRKITFATGKPLGLRGTFTHEGEQWISYPVEKNQALFVVTTRLLGILAAINSDMIRMLNDHPEDANHVLTILDRIKRGRAQFEELSNEQARVFTS